VLIRHAISSLLNRRQHRQLCAFFQLQGTAQGEQQAWAPVAAAMQTVPPELA
jgi:hypothetical protein